MKLLIALALLLAGCTNTISLTVNLPGDTPTVQLEPQQPQTKPDRYDL